MKKILSLMLSVLMLMSLCACGGGNDKEPKLNVAASEADIAQLDALYTDREAKHGEAHDHSNSGGRSDGKVALAEWPSRIMVEKDMDFAIIVDHHQSLHMRLEEWDNTKLIGGTEAGTTLVDNRLEQGNMHYNLIFSDPDKLDELLKSFRLYNFRPYLEYERPGENTFTYADFTVEGMREVAAKTLELGGFYVMVHPLFASYLKSQNIEDYWMGDYTGFEIYTAGSKDLDPSYESNQKAYDTWVELLNLGKKFYATCGSDSHRESNVRSLSTLYASKVDGAAYLDHIRAGDFTAGPVGIRMAVGDTHTGGETDFAGKRLVVSVGDFHTQAYQEDHKYRLDVYNETGLVFSQALSGSETVYYAMDAADCQYYRANVYDVTGDYIFAVGNPIWNASK